LDSSDYLSRKNQLVKKMKLCLFKLALAEQERETIIQERQKISAEIQMGYHATVVN
jgi:uncharacterized protein (UPF0303 family)